MNCVILGAGKIARGFIGHLLYLSEIPFTFVEKADSLVDLINERGRYFVNIMGNPEQSGTVSGAKAYSFSQEEEIIRLICEANAVFTAVGGKNLKEIAPMLARGIRARADEEGILCSACPEDQEGKEQTAAEKTGKSRTSLNIITCENWKQPAALLREEIGKYLDGEALEYFNTNVGVTEAVIMRSAVEASQEQRETDPLIVNVQDYWELPVDASRVVGSLPEIKGLKLLEEFSGFLERKFYTSNAGNGTTSFLGALLGYEKIADAAHDERILKILDGVYMETAQALCRKHNFPMEEQLEFAGVCKAKLQNYTIVDFVERNARDPIRKLGPDDRLVGSARLVQEYGIVPENLCTAIAAAIYYENEADEFAVKLKELRINQGIDAVLSQVCRLEPDGELGTLIKSKIALLKERGWIHE